VSWTGCPSWRWATTKGKPCAGDGQSWTELEIDFGQSCPLFVSPLPTWATFPLQDTVHYIRPMFL
jgi:hypothetical protein